MEQKFYSTVEAADKAGITGAPSGVGKTFRRLAAKLGLVPTKEKGALCWTEADIAEVKANYKPRAKRTAAVAQAPATVEVGEVKAEDEPAGRETVEPVISGNGGTLTVESLEQKRERLTSEMNTLFRFLHQSDISKKANDLYNRMIGLISRGEKDSDEYKQLEIEHAPLSEKLQAAENRYANLEKELTTVIAVIKESEAACEFVATVDAQEETVAALIRLAEFLDLKALPLDQLQAKHDKACENDDTRYLTVINAVFAAHKADNSSTATATDNLITPLAADTPEVDGKKIMPATADQSNASEENVEIQNQSHNSTGGGIVQQLNNLPAELLSLPRWIEVGTADNPKRPKTGSWQRVENQRYPNDLRGNVGFVCSVHQDDRQKYSDREDYLLIDGDHVLDPSTGEFVNQQAQTWINFLLTSLDDGGNVFCERSLSKSGVHILCKPTRGKFNLAGADDGTLYFGEHETKEQKKACPKLELFVGSEGRQVVVTGDLYNCTADAVIPSGGNVDAVVETLINQIMIQNKSKAEQVDPKPVTVKKPFSGRGIAQETIDAINKIAAARIKAAGLVTKAPSGHFICPRCGSGTHANASGALASDDNRGFTHWHCHSGSCTFDGNNIQLFAEIWKLNPSADFIEVVTRAAERFDIPVEYTAPTDNGTQSKLRDCPINLVIPENFIFNQRGITFEQSGKKDQPPRKIVVSRTPIVPTRIFRDVTSGAIRYEVGIKFRGQWRRTETDGRTLTDPRNILSLAEHGALIIEPKLACRYFADLISGNDTLPEVKSFNKPGWYKVNGNETFIYPTGDNSVDGYVVRRSNLDYEDLFSVEGDPEAWKEKFTDILRRSVIHRTVIGASLAAPLLKVLELPNFCLHVEGNSNAGKSPLVKFALSIYGDPTEGQLFRTFDATAKNLITTAAGFNDLPQAVDEAESMSKRAYEEFSKTVYDYCLGVINQANQRNGNVRKAEKFRGVRITTGERPLLKITDKKGAFKRLITLHVDQPLFTNKEAGALHRFCERNHGHFGRLWTGYIAANRDRITRDFNELLAEIQDSELAQQIDEPAVTTVTACNVAFWHFRLCLGLWNKGFEHHDAEHDINSILRRLPTKDETSDLTRGISLLASWLNEHPKNFSRVGDESSTEISAVSFTETSGVIFTDGRVGFFQNAFRRIVEKELELPSYQKFLADLYDADMLICPKHGNEKAIQKKIGGQNKKVYLFKTGVLVSPADSEDAESADEPA